MADPTPPPAIVADDLIRSRIAWAVIFNDGITCLAVMYFLFSLGGALPKDVLAIISTIVGGIVGYRARDTGTVIGYLFGSSSGSTAKSALLEKSVAPAGGVVVTPSADTKTTATVVTETPKPTETRP